MSSLLVQLAGPDWSWTKEKLEPCRSAAYGCTPDPATMLPPPTPPYIVQNYDPKTGKVFSGPDTTGHRYFNETWEGPTEDPFGFRRRYRLWMEQHERDTRTISK